jgi:cell division transport system ATP-binding protein
MKLLHLTAGYTAKPVIKHLSLDIHPGEWIFLIGASGSGKSTFLQTIFGNLEPLQGSVIDDNGRDIYQLSPSQLRAHRRTCGMIFQDYKLIEYKTVSENIAYAMEMCSYGKSTIQKRVPELLEYVGLMDKKDTFPKHLSGGEAQRVAIARALIHNPKMILADEPTGNLDYKNVMNIIDLLKTINAQGTTVIFATHDLELLQQVPKAKVLDIRKLG